MLKTLEKAIYYDRAVPGYHILASFEYSDIESFQDVINSLTNNIEIISIFAPKGDPIYSHLSYLTKYYHSLLLDKTQSLYLVNRKDMAIQIQQKGVETSNNAFLKTDAIFSEQYLSKSNFLLYSSFLLLGGLISYEAYKIGLE